MNPEYNITSKEIEDGKVMAGIAYLGVIGFIIAFATSQNNRYVIYHAQQSLALIIAGFAISMISIVDVPIVGWIINLSIMLAGVGAFILFIMGMINGFSGKVEPLPVIGEYAYKLNLVKKSSNHYQQQSYDEHKYPPSPNMVEPSRKKNQDKDPYSYGDEFRKDKF